MSIVVVTEDPRDFEQNECAYCWELIKEGPYKIKCGCDVSVHEKCIIEWIRKTPLNPPPCPWCTKPITDREILIKSRDPNKTIIKVITLSSFIIFAGVAAAWQLFQERS